jgi:hypothetical protein
VNLLLYHGVLAPRARWRSHVVRYGRPTPADPALEPAARARAGPFPAPTSTWATLMRRVFDLDVLACPRCGGRLRIVATVYDPTIVRAILDYLGMASGPDPPRAAQSAPARSPAHEPWLTRPATQRTELRRLLERALDSSVQKARHDNVVIHHVHLTDELKTLLDDVM